MKFWLDDAPCKDLNVISKVQIKDGGNTVSHSLCLIKNARKMYEITDIDKNELTQSFQQKDFSETIYSNEVIWTQNVDRKREYNKQRFEPDKEIHEEIYAQGRFKKSWESAGHDSLYFEILIGKRRRKFYHKLCESFQGKVLPLGWKVAQRF